MSPDSTLIFVDGENLAFRYKEMLASGRVPRPDNVYIEDCFIWNQGILDKELWKIKSPLNFPVIAIGRGVSGLSGALQLIDIDC